MYFNFVLRNNLYNIKEEFGIPNKFVTLAKMYMEATIYQVRVDSKLSDAFTVETGLKQDETLSPILFNLAPEKAMKIMKLKARRIAINDHRLHSGFCG